VCGDLVLPDASQNAIAGSAEGENLNLLAQLPGVFRQAFFEGGRMSEVTPLCHCADPIPGRMRECNCQSAEMPKDRELTAAFSIGSLHAANGIFRSRPGTFRFSLN